jgi:hypothetical protein
MKYRYEALVEWRRRNDNKSTWRNTFSNATFLTTNPKHTGLESNPGLFSDGSATSCLSRGKAKTDTSFASELLTTTQPIRTQYNLHCRSLLIGDSCPVEMLQQTRFIVQVTERERERESTLLLAVWI